MSIFNISQYRYCPVLYEDLYEIEADSIEEAISFILNHEVESYVSNIIEIEDPIKIELYNSNKKCIYNKNYGTR